MGSKCLSVWLSSVVCLSNNVQGVIFNQSGSNLNPICILKLSRGTFFFFWNFHFLTFFGQFLEISRSFFQNSDIGLKFWQRSSNWTHKNLFWFFPKFQLFQDQKAIISRSPKRKRRWTKLLCNLFSCFYLSLIA